MSDSSSVQRIYLTIGFGWVSWVVSSHQVAKVLELQPHHSRWWSRRMCAHPLLQDHQNCNSLLNNHRTECWIPLKKDTPCPWAKETPQQDSRRGEIAFRIKSNLTPARDAQRAQTKSYAHQDPGKRAVTPTRDWARSAFECVSISCRGTGQQWLATGTGALAAADLEGVVCSISPLGEGQH